MNKIDFNLACPVCKGPLRPRVLVCACCDIRVEGPFTSNEFASLNSNLLHFLRIFVHCEGRIKDMEKALGVSYPTVKATIGQLKRALKMPDAEGTPGLPTDDRPGSSAPPAATMEAPMDVLNAVARGDLGFEAALRRLRGQTSPTPAKPVAKKTNKP